MSWLDAERERWLRKAVAYERQLEKATRPLKSSADFFSYKQKEEVRRRCKGRRHKGFQGNGCGRGEASSAGQA